jgi:hypothetical protein
MILIERTHSKLLYLSTDHNNYNTHPNLPKHNLYYFNQFQKHYQLIPKNILTLKCSKLMCLFILINIIIHILCYYTLLGQLIIVYSALLMILDALEPPSLYLGRMCIFLVAIWFGCGVCSHHSSESGPILMLLGRAYLPISGFKRLFFRFCAWGRKGRCGKDLF